MKHRTERLGLLLTVAVVIALTIALASNSLAGVDDNLYGPAGNPYPYSPASQPEFYPRTPAWQLEPYPVGGDSFEPPPTATAQAAGPPVATDQPKPAPKPTREATRAPRK